MDRGVSSIFEEGRVVVILDSLDLVLGRRHKTGRLHAWGASYAGSSAWRLHVRGRAHARGARPRSGSGGKRRGRGYTLTAEVVERNAIVKLRVAPKG